MKLKIALLSICLATTIAHAHPDVFFEEDFTLMHQLADDFTYITFSMNKDIGVEVPKDFFHYDTLKAFVKDTYEFNNPNLKADFLRMFARTISSNHQPKPFIEELVLLLVAFKGAHPELVHEER